MSWTPDKTYNEKPNINDIIKEICDQDAWVTGESIPFKLEPEHSLFIDYSDGTKSITGGVCVERGGFAYVKFPITGKLAKGEKIIGATLYIAKWKEDSLGLDSNRV